jgi:hypothetical protein
MIISLRGTNGSGKSTVIRALLSQCGSKPIYGALGHRLPEAYRLSVPRVKTDTFLLGPYTTECGGCDRLIPFELIPRLIENYAAKGHVIFEGVIVASMYGQVGRLLERWGKQAVLLMLETSLDECVARVRGRRSGRGDTRVFDPSHLARKFEAVRRVGERAQADGILRVETVADTDAVKLMITMLQRAKWTAVASAEVTL